MCRDLVANHKQVGEFIDIDLEVPTSRSMEVEEIIDFVVHPSVSLVEVNSESEDEDESMTKIISSKEALFAMTQVKLFFEQNDLTALTDKEQLVIKNLSSLNEAIFKIKNSKAKQKEITSFFF